MKYKYKSIQTVIENSSSLNAEGASVKVGLDIAKVEGLFTNDEDGDKFDCFIIPNALY